MINLILVFPFCTLIILPRLCNFVVMNLYKWDPKPCWFDTRLIKIEIIHNLHIDCNRNVSNGLCSNQYKMVYPGSYPLWSTREYLRVTNEYTKFLSNWTLLVVSWHLKETQMVQNDSLFGAWNWILLWMKGAEKT